MGALERFSLSGRVAVVTGGTRGLGAGFAAALGDAGASVVLVGRDEDAAEGVLKSLRDKDIRAEFVQADVTVPADVEHVLATTLDHFGRVDVLVNNAGACVHAPALDVTPEDWRSVMDVNLDAEWAPYGVRVNALAPGYIKTDMSPVDDPAFRRHWIEDAPMQRYGTVEELAPAVVFLASDASSFVTGSVLVADGGYTPF